jgi:hypothetical protein
MRSLRDRTIDSRIGGIEAIESKNVNAPPCHYQISGQCEVFLALLVILIEQFNSICNDILVDYRFNCHVLSVSGSTARAIRATKRPQPADTFRFSRAF